MSTIDRNFNEYWNENLAKHSHKELKYDLWLDKYLPILKNGKILEIGCGLGNNAQYLVEHGLTEIATDLSEVAIKNIQEKLPTIKTKQVDISKKMPFKDNSFDVVIADLCLHYFSEELTKKIMLELKRIIKNKGHLLARVNSVYDTNHGAGQGKMLENNFYFVEGYNKRFFDEKDVNKFFGIVGKVEQSNSKMMRYEKAKEVIEICVTCDKQC